MVNQNPAPPTMSSLLIAEQLEAWPERFAVRLASALGTRQVPGGQGLLCGQRSTISSNRQQFLSGR
jgi:hypothetical protein